MLSSILQAAQATGGNGYTPTLPGGIIILGIICNSRKKKPIGGWLLFYFWQLYAGLVVTTLQFSTNLQSYVPENFDDKHLFYLFIVSSVPLLIVYALQVAVATFLISVKTWDLVRLLRSLIMTEIVAITIAIPINAKYFPDNIFINVYNLLLAFAWLIYFFKAQRVIHVFKTHDWDKPVRNPGLEGATSSIY